MEFGPIPVSASEGSILAHGVRTGSRVFKKGRLLSAADVAALLDGGISEVIAARLGVDDIGEDEAASRLAERLAGRNVRKGAAFTGRANLYAKTSGLVLVDAERVSALNRIDEAITFATLRPFERVSPGLLVATVKIIPFAAPKVALEAAERLLADSPPLSIAPFAPRNAALISTKLPGTKDVLLNKNRQSIDARLNSIASSVTFETRVSHNLQALTSALHEAAARGCDPILVLGASAITDRRDVIPAAIVAAGGSVDHFGMPVDPGNLLLVGRFGGAHVIGLPGCARSPRLNGVDFVLWRLAAELPVGRDEITAMAVGGLLAEIPTRPQPRDEAPSVVPRAPKIAGIVLAAGRSSRMGSNKLLADIRGEPMVRHTVKAALNSSVGRVVVVTGNESDRVTNALRGLHVQIAENAEFARGLSTSLRCGLQALPDDVDGALVLLGDMPSISTALVEKLIAAFNPGEGRAICVATRDGKQGNPVLWARRFFPDLISIEGDVGGRNLLGVYGELVCEVEAETDAPLLDIDTPEALAAYLAEP